MFGKMPISRVGFQFIQIIMSSRNLKLVRRILEVLDNVEIPMDSSTEVALQAFEGFNAVSVEMHFRILCQHGFLLLKQDESWHEVKPGWRPLSWIGFDLLEQLQKSQNE